MDYIYYSWTARQLLFFIFIWYVDKKTSIKKDLFLVSSNRMRDFRNYVPNKY